MQFWSDDCLTAILAPVGMFIKMDDYIKNKLKVQFAKALVQISVVHPVPGSLFLNHPDGIKQIHLNYEEMDEVCSLCGNDSHSLDGFLKKVNPSMHMLI